MDSISKLPHWLFPVLAAVSAAIIGLIHELRDIDRHSPTKSFRLGHGSLSMSNVTNLFRLLWRWAPYLFTITFLAISSYMYGDTVQAHYITRIDSSGRSYIPNRVEIYSADEHPLLAISGWFPRRDLKLATSAYKRKGLREVTVFAVVRDLGASNRGLVWIQVPEGDKIKADGSYRVGAYLGGTGRFCARDGQEFQVMIYIPPPGIDLSNGRFADDELPKAIYLSDPFDVRVDRPSSFSCPP